MNRRDFLKLSALFTGAAATLPFMRIEDEMQLSDVWLKMANQQALTSEEKDFLHRMGDETQQRNAQIGGWTSGDGNPTFNTPYAKDMNFDIIPLGSVFFNGTSGGQQSIPNNTHTVIGNSITAGANISTNKYFHSSDDNSKLYIDKTPFRFFFYGHGEFVSNATGYRGMRWYYYNADGTVNRFRSLIRTPAISGNATNFIFCASVQIFSNMNVGDYFSFTAYQNSGAALGLDDFGYGAFAIA